MSETASLRELVDLNELQATQDSFAKTVGTSSVIFSPEGEQLTQFSNPTGFCALIQSTGEGKRRCFVSFMEMSQKALELEEPVIYYCFAHVGHFVAPIIIDGEHKGTMFAGQFIPQKFSAEQLKTLGKIAVEINVDPNLLVEEAKKMRVVEEDRVWNYSSLLFQIVKVIARLGAQATELGRAKDALQKAHDELECRVKERTAELVKANEQLKQEITERKQAEDALWESEEKIRSITASAHDAIIMVDNEGNISFWNEAAEMIFGYTEEEMIGTKLHDSIVPERFREDFLNGFKSFRETGQGAAIGKTLELAANRKDGIELPVELSLSAVKLKGKWNAIGLLRDITERKQAEEQLRLFLQAADSSIDGIAMGNLEGIITYANETFVRMFGYSREELIGKGIPFIYPEDQLPKLEEALKATMEGGWTGELVAKRKNGELFPMAVASSRVVDDEGNVIAHMASYRDITERKKAENELKEAKERYETLFEFATNGILIADIETRKFKYANPAICRMLGYSVEELKRMDESDIHPKDQLEHVISEFEAQARGEKTLAPNIPCLRKDGTIIYADINTTRASIDGRECNIGFFRDITERKQAEDAIKKRNEELKRFNKLAVDREMVMIELKQEVNKLSARLDKKPPYDLSFVDEAILRKIKESDRRIK
ncbi:MAG TPA: PAS domain S-box protein [Methanophagales archaeon]|nr:PAS domain S-box protein [Methanophagales archaeon]